MSRNLRVGFPSSPFVLQASPGAMWVNGIPVPITSTGTPPPGPLILYTSSPDGPTTGGENNKGCYLWIYGVGLGSFSNYGTIGTRHVTIGGVEVDNYRFLSNAVQNGAGTEGPGALWPIQVLCVQVGALGTPTVGTAIAIDIVNNSNTSIATNAKSGGFNLDIDSNQISFTPLANSNIYYVSLSGTDQTGFGNAPPTGTQGTISNPLRHLQTYNSSSGFGGALWGTANSATGATTRVQPGTHIYIRTGEYGSDTSLSGSWGDFFRITGLPSGTGTAGTILISAHPGAAGANSPETVTYTTTSGGAGGFNFSDTARSSETTAFGTNGWCHYISICNLHIFGNPGAFNSSGAAGCPVNWQTQAVGSQVINCELTYPCSATSAQGSPTSGGMGGYASFGRRLGNYVHDVYDPSGNLQNHGFYIGENTGSSSTFGQGEQHTITAYNCMYRTTGGQGIMMRGAYPTSGDETAPFCSIHHNYIVGPGKFGIEMFDNRNHGIVWNNIIIGQAFTAAGTTGTQAGYWMGSDNITTSVGIYVGYNTFIGVYNHYAIIASNGGANTGSVLVESNIVRQDSSAGNSSSGFFSNWLFGNEASAPITLSRNCWFDATGTSSNPSDSTGLFVDPLLNSVVSPYDAHPSGTSTMPNKGNTPPGVSIPAIDFYFYARPQAANSKWTIGAVERLGG